MTGCLPAARALVRTIVVLGSVASLTSLAPSPSHASVLTYCPTRTAFDGAAPGLPVQDFQPITDPGLIHSPLSNSSNNTDFPPGNILPGITFSASGGDLYIFNGALSTFTFERKPIMSFAPGVAAVGLDWFGSTGSPGGGKAGDFTAQMFNGATLLGTQTLSEPANATGFFGVSSTTDISEIDITFQATCTTSGCDAGDANPFIDNIAFGPPTLTPIPEPTSLTLFLSAGAAFWFIRRPTRLPPKRARSETHLRLPILECKTHKLAHRATAFSRSIGRGRGRTP
jgi:hypothetical protein